MVGFSEIQLGEDSSLSEGLESGVHKRWGVLVLDRYVVELVIVNAESETTILHYKEASSHL